MSNGRDFFNDGMPEESRPQHGDSKEMLLIRTLIGNSHRLASLVHDVQDRLESVEKQTSDCSETKKEVTRLVKVLSPESSPQRHIDVRVKSLEDRSNSLGTKGWAIFQALLVAGLIATCGWALATASKVNDVSARIEAQAPKGP
jgi:hypothetical protein